LQVLYLDVQEGHGCDTLRQLAATLRGHFSSQGLFSDDSGPFTPHVTIAKLSNLRSYSMRKRLSRIPEVSILQLLLARRICKSASLP
jgi:2'-5' RNA ligase